MYKLTLTLAVILLTPYVYSQSQKVNYTELYFQAPACQMGRLQSPVNLMESQSTFNSTINILYDSYQVLNNAQLAFDQRTMFVTFTNSEANLGYATLSRNGVLKKYALTRIELTYAGEHLIEGVPSDLEVKFIHSQVQFFETTVNQYRQLADANSNLIISVMFKKGGKAADNGFISDLMKTTAGQTLDLNIDSYDLFRDRQFFFYEGSFTYAPCDENVNHIVVRDIFTILPEHLDYIANQYKLRFSGDGKTNKPVSDLNGRTVFRNYHNATDLSGGFYKASSILVMLLLLFI
jgi:carbonic anhydrase